MKRRRRGESKILSLGGVAVALFILALGATIGGSGPPWLIFVPSSLWLPLSIWSCLILRRSPRGGLPLALIAFFFLLGPLMGYHRQRQVAAEPQPGPSFRVVCMNAASWEADIVDVGRRTAELRPDVLLLQEMWSISHLKSFKVGLPGLLFRGDATGYRGTTIGSRYSMEPCPKPPPERTVGSILTISGQKFLFLSVHGRKASSGLADPVKSFARQKVQAQEIADYVEDMGLPVVLGGDFNGSTGAPLYSVLSEKLVDSFALAGQGYSYTFPSTFPLARLDFVLFSPGPVQVIGYQVVDVGSDHLALVVDFLVSENLVDN